jgi:hypothetical protein
MKQAKTSIFRVLAAFAAALLATPALAAAPAAPDLARWISQSTDLVASQVAIAGPDAVYSVEPLGPRAATGEVIALVRTETVAAEWGTAHGFRSWDAHVLFDCNGGRMRVIRSATYPEPNRKGRPSSEVRDDGWLSPEPSAPAARLVAAACDPGYAWPLRARVATAPPEAAKAAPAPATAEPQASPPQAAARTPAAPVQAARAQAAPAQAASAQAASAQAAPTQTAHVQAAPAPTATVQAAHVQAAHVQAAPAQAATAQPTRVQAAPAQAATTQTTRVQAAPAQAAPAQIQRVQAAPAAPATAGRLAVQVARGPSEAGAKKVLQKARGILGASAGDLTAATEESWRGRRRRYTALLIGFPSAEAAEAACARLIQAGQDCQTRRLPKASSPKPLKLVQLS